MVTHDDLSAASHDRAAPLTLRYAVIACGQEWRVVSGRAQIGHFETRVEALAVAINLTKEALAEGHEAELLAQPEGPDAEMRPLFSS